MFFVDVCKGHFGVTLVLVYISECARLGWEVSVLVMSECNCVIGVFVLCIGNIV